MLNFLVPVAVALIGTTLHAQCATLAANGTGSAGSNLTLAISGANANQFAFLLFGNAVGTSSLQLGPFGAINFGVAQPWVPYYVGQTTAGGEADVTVAIPLSLPASIPMAAQGLTLGANSAALSSCTTNVVMFRIG